MRPTRPFTIDATRSARDDPSVHTPWEPFSTARTAALLAELANVPRDMAALVAARAQLSGQRASLATWQSLCDGDAAFARACFATIVPAIFAAARQLLAAGSPTLHIHAPHTAARTTIPRVEVAGWLAHLVLGTLEPASPVHPALDLQVLLDEPTPSQCAKLRCVLAYFARAHPTAPSGSFTVERRVLPARTDDEWLADETPLTAFTVDTHHAIEDLTGHHEIDFANRWLGGGVLGHGCVQEEIRFVLAPELLVAMILSPVMADDEAIVIHGTERFSRTRGYARSLEYVAPLVDAAPQTRDGTPQTTVIAIDALDYRRSDARTQFSRAAMLRELAKARVGFSFDETSHASAPPIATGNWGCGVFGGDLPLKAIVQWLAASSVGRPLTYCTFGDVRTGDLATFTTNARPRFGTVGALWRGLRAEVADGGPALYDRLLAR